MRTFLELTSRYRLHGVLHAEEGLHIGTGVPNPHTDAPFIRDHGVPFLPGSSLRGAMRSTLERMVRALWGPNACCALFTETHPEANSAPACWVASKEKQDSVAQSQNGAAALLRSEANLCPVCQLFGSTLMAARLKVRDATLQTPTEPLRRDGVGIDRDTDTAADAIKFDFEVLERGCNFDFHLELENATPTDQALLYILLKELEQGIDIGGKKMRGLGRVKLTTYTVEYFDADWNHPLTSYLENGFKSATQPVFEAKLKPALTAKLNPPPPPIEGAPHADASR
jgi:CRISPR-associated RAMP protein (TIGR02581 family)